MKNYILIIVAAVLMLSGCTAPAEQIVTIAADSTPIPAVTPVQTAIPTEAPVAEPAAVPTPQSTAKVTAIPTAKVTATPTAKVTATPTAKVTATPVPTPTVIPTAQSTPEPTPEPTAVPTAVPTAEPSQSTDTSDFGGNVLALVNSYRSAAGLNSLKYSSSMQKAADIRAKECIQSFSHTRPDGSEAHTVLAEINISFTAFGENLFKATGMGDVSAEFVVEQWMASPGHRQNIMQEMFTHMSIGVALKGDELYVVQLFGTGLS